MFTHNEQQNHMHFSSFDLIKITINNINDEQNFKLSSLTKLSDLTNSQYKDQAANYTITDIFALHLWMNILYSRGSETRKDIMPHWE